MKIILFTVNLMICTFSYSQNEWKHIINFEKIKGDKLSFTGNDDSLVWQLLVSSDNKFKIKKEEISNQNTHQTTPVIAQLGFVGTIASAKNHYILTFNYPSTNKSKLEKLFKLNKSSVKVLDEKTVLIDKNLNEIWINNVKCRKVIHGQ